MLKALRINDFWRWLPAFRVVAEKQQLRSAARILHVSPSALSRTVKLMEDAVGTALFHRRGRTLRLSSAGEELLHAVRSAMRLMDEGLTRATSGLYAGPVRVCAPAPLLHLVARAIGRVQVDQPELTGHVTCHPQIEINSRLLRGEIDVALLDWPERESQIEIGHLASLTRSIYCGPRHPLAAARRPAREKILEHPFATLEPETAHLPPDGWPPRLERKVKLVSPDFHSLLQLCESGETLSVFEDSTVADSVKRKRLKRIKLDVVPERSVFFARRISLTDQDLATLILEAIRSELGQGVYVKSDNLRIAPMPHRSFVLVSLVLAWVAILAWGCGDTRGQANAGNGEDAGADILEDGGPDATDEMPGDDASHAPDGTGPLDGADAGHDAGHDAGYDAGYDAGHDAGYDAGIDAAPDGTDLLDGAGGDEQGDGEDAHDDDIVDPVVTCADTPPPGAELADPPPAYSEGACPQLVPGRNTLPSGGNDREFLLVVPADLSPDEHLPLVFMWHWLAGEADDFLEKGEVQQAVDQMRFLAAIPEARGDSLFVWPVLTPPLNFDARRDEELVFFDDMLACIAEQFNLNTECVSTAGVSAGGLWTSQLAQHRSRHLASFQSLSGGIGPVVGGYIPIREWDGMDHAMPALVLWGGPTDFCIVPFAAASLNLEAKLDEGGHYVLECIHNCSHAEPPFEPPAGFSVYAGLWDFSLTHPYWLDDGVSPYQTTGLPEALPEWCGQGTGGATIRDGECEGGILGSCQ